MNIPYPETLDTTHNPPWHMDAIHIRQLYRICIQARIHSVIEVGSYLGASTSAFVEAINAGVVSDLLCHDTEPTASLRSVLARATLGHAEVLGSPFYCHPRKADLILIDGDHGWPATADLAAALAMDIPHIVLHDTMGYFDCHGSKRAGDLLRKATKYRCYEDNRRRPGMLTERGLMYACHNNLIGGWDYSL